MPLEMNCGVAFIGSDLPPKGYADPIMNDGTKFLLDFTRADCNPNADGALAVGSVFHDLVSGNADWTIVRPGGVSPVTQRPGRMGLSWADNSLVSQVDTIRSSAAKLWNADQPLTLWAWIKQSGLSVVANYARLFGRSAAVNGNTNACQVAIDTGNGGANPRGSVLPASSGVGIATGPGAALSRDTVHLLTLEYVPNSTLVMYFDGVVSQRLDSSIPAALADDTGWYNWLAFVGGGVVYRIGAESPTQSGRSASQLAAAEKALKNGIFS
ncbi:hypothetical protein ABIC63_002130 [Pseudacidovorax sp. 1753]|uniref:hypothetical protein n=1 Tax=Pseudacidovorax sp. 1753 TaxID=3156419 RepID=UPI003395F8A8